MLFRSDNNVDKKTWKLLEKAVLASVSEQRRSRRWGIFFKTLTFTYFLSMLHANNEMIILANIGYSFKRIIVPIILLGFFAIRFQFIFSEKIAITLRPFFPLF